MVRARRRLDLEVDRLADVDAHLGREALDRWSPIPLTCQSEGGSPGFVFSQATALVTGGGAGVGCECVGASQRGDHHDREQRNREQAECPETSHPYMERPVREPKLQPRKYEIRPTREVRRRSAAPARATRSPQARARCGRGSRARCGGSRSRRRACRPVPSACARMPARPASTLAPRRAGHHARGLGDEGATAGGVLDLQQSRPPLAGSPSARSPATPASRRGREAAPSRVGRRLWRPTISALGPIRTWPSRVRVRWAPRNGSSGSGTG